MNNKGFEAELSKEVNLNDQKVSDKDLCISFGGDNTFLRTASFIKDSDKTKILGVCHMGISRMTNYNLSGFDDLPNLVNKLKTT